MPVHAYSDLTFSNALIADAVYYALSSHTAEPTFFAQATSPVAASLHQLVAVELIMTYVSEPGVIATRVKMRPYRTLYDALSETYPGFAPTVVWGAVLVLLLNEHTLHRVFSWRHLLECSCGMSYTDRAGLDEHLAQQLARLLVAAGAHACRAS